jgi:hypothetical protein
MLLPASRAWGWLLKPRISRGHKNWLVAPRLGLNEHSNRATFVLRGFKLSSAHSFESTCSAAISYRTNSVVRNPKILFLAFANQFDGDLVLMPRVRLRLLATLLAASLLPALAIRFATSQHTGVDTYAITNARIAPVSGALIERGTIVFRNGLIVAVGANVSAPSDARVIDGSGLTVYPGLIDSYTNLALPEASPAPSVGGGGGGGFFLQQQAAAQPRPGGPNSTQPPGLQPETMVEEVIRTGGADVDSARNAGFTTALTLPRSGIWIGQSALINLAGDSK